MLSLQDIIEAEEKHAVLAYGRMNPPTTGHAKLVDKVHEVAKAHNAHHEVVLSHSEDPKKNPLSQSQKVKHAKRFFPHTNITAAGKSAPTIFHHAAKLHKAGYQHLHVVAGDDRVKEYSHNLHKYNGHFDKEGHGYKFKSITVHSAGKRDPKATGTEGMSASKMREHASKGNFHEFKKGIPSHVKSEHAKELYNDVRKGQGVKEEWEGMGHINESVDPHDTDFGRVESVARLHGFVPHGHLHPSVGGKEYVHKKNSNYGLTVTGNGHWIHGLGTTTYKSGDGAQSLRNHISQYHKPEEVKEEVEYLMEHVSDAGIFKAVFLAGTPGSGKDIVLKKALQGHGMTEVNSEVALNHLTDKEKLDDKMSEGEQERRGVHSQKAKSLQDLRQRLAIHGRNGLVINSTHADHGHIKKIKDKLEKLGYDSKMVFVDASDNVSRNRNVERGQKGGRMLPEKDRAEKWRKAQDARVKLAKEFGGEHYHEFSNDEDLRQNVDPDVAGQKTSELQDLHKTIKKWTQTPPQSEDAQKWIYSKISKIAKAPIGNKKQQEKVLPPPTDSKAKEEAQKLGLQYYGNGKYGKDKRVTHFVLHDRLVEKIKALKPPVDKDAKKKPDAKKSAKKLNEEFEKLFESQEPVEFEQLRYEPLTEGDPIIDPGTEPGPALGGRPAETNDMSRGGQATSVPKKTLKDMLKKKVT